MAAATCFISLPLPPNSSSLLRSSSSRVQKRSPATFKTSFITCSAAPSTSSAAPPKPQIELEFIGPKDGDVAQASAVSGDKLLRSIMLENKIELYALYGKLMNCGGGGSCGTCVVEIIDGKDLLNERTDTEKRYLKKKPESWRLACQTIVGNKENSGKVIVRRLPQSSRGYLVEEQDVSQELVLISQGETSPQFYVST